jgi:DNA-directed RNA polymerase specialized sigma24 family protein
MTSFPSLSDPQPGSNASTAIHQLMRQRGGMIFGLRQKFCGNDDDATNPVQETMLEAFKSWPLFRGGAKATTWLYCIVARTCQRMHEKNGPGGV